MASHSTKVLCRTMLCLAASAALAAPAAPEETELPRFGAAWTVPELAMTLVPVAPGTFTHGIRTGASDVVTSRLPRVTHTRSFWIGRFEVTQAEFAAVMRVNRSRFRGRSLPVDSVSWHDAHAFCERITERERQNNRLPEGYVYRLPTDAEWEYCCRAGTTGDFPGDVDLLAWHAGNSEKTSHEVGTRDPNPWGIHDMHGNVAEWCYDFLRLASGSTGTDVLGQRGQGMRACRGGSWAGPAGDCTAWSVSGQFLTRRAPTNGFRVVLAPDVGAAFFPAKGQSWQPPGLEIEFCAISPGLVSMGPRPGHTVELPSPSWLGRCEVTVGDFLPFLAEAGPVQGVDWTDPDCPFIRTGKGIRLRVADDGETVHLKMPLTEVTWHGAMAYCSWLTARETAARRLPGGYGYRLPTEPEWEYACRAGLPEATADALSDTAWFADNSDRRPHDVGAKSANRWKLNDMLGNVSEWCLGGPGSGAERPIRGGSFYDSAPLCRASASRSVPNDWSTDHLGFRVVLAPVQDGLPRPEASRFVEQPLPAPAAPVVGKPWRQADLDMAFVPVPAGLLAPGRDTPAGSLPDTPAVIFREPFWAAACETTTGQFSRFLQQTSPGGEAGEERDMAANLPAANVSLEQATAFCRWLTELERHAGRLPMRYVFRLPVEHEWEYCCRAGTRGDFPDDTDELTWHADNSAGTSHAVASRSPNPWGIHDMHGNVREWCLPEENTSTAPGVTRGGSFNTPPIQCTSWHRTKAGDQAEFGDIGFRVILAPPLTTAPPSR